MSRVGKKPIEVPSDVTITLGDKNEVTVKGHKGELTRAFNQDITISREDNVLTLTRPSDSQDPRPNPRNKPCIASEHGYRRFTRFRAQT